MSLSLDAKVSLASMFVTLVSMVLTIWMASRVKKVKSQIALDIRRVNLAHASRSIEKTLGDIRKLQVTPLSNARGRGRLSSLDIIQGHFDTALMQVDLDGPDADIRSLISDAQVKLQALRNESEQEKCDQLISEIQSLVQDTVSKLNGRYLRLDEKAQ